MPGMLALPCRSLNLLGTGFHNQISRQAELMPMFEDSDHWQVAHITAPYAPPAPSGRVCHNGRRAYALTNGLVRRDARRFASWERIVVRAFRGWEDKSRVCGE